jgi:hypothetical protein
MFFEAMQKVAAVQILQDPDAKKLRMEARKAAKEARLVERRKEKEEHQKCKAIERYERDRSSRELVLKWSFRFSNISCWKYSPFPYWLIFLVLQVFGEQPMAAPPVSAVSGLNIVIWSILQ